MLSSNNKNEMARKQQPSRQRFAIKKFTVGVASVLIGFTFMDVGASANTDTQTPASNTPTVATAASTANNHSGNQVVLHQSGAASSAATSSATAKSSAASSSATSAISSATTSVASATTSSAAKSSNAVASSAVSSPAVKPMAASSAATSADSSTTTLTINPSTLAGNTLPADQLRASMPTATGQAQSVKKADALVNALKDTNVGTINLDNDIDFSGYTETAGALGLQHHSYATISGDDVRNITVNLNGHKLTMGDRYFYFEKGTQNKNWNLTFNGGSGSTPNIANELSFTNNTYGPINFQGINNNANNTVTFNNVNMTGSQFGGADTATSNTDVKFSGDNKINATNTANHAAFLVDSVEVLNGTTTINDSNNAANQNRNAAIFIDSKSNSGNVVIDQGATLTLNGQTSNTMGIFFDGYDSNSTIDKARTGLIKVNGNLNINLKDGNSSAIYADDLDVGQGATVNIDTAQNTTSGLPGNMLTNLGGIHNGVINLGMHASTTSNELQIANNGALNVTRNGDKSTSALISFGGNGINRGINETVKVNQGGTLDLQDYAQIQNNWNHDPSSKIPSEGLITMWGSSSTDTVDIENPKYVNLQRLSTPTSGSDTGSLLRLEGTTNNVKINVGTADAVTPIAQWDAGANAPSFYWYIKEEANQNNWGNNANGFTAKGNTDPQNATGEQTFRNSNGTVVLAPNQAGKDGSEFRDGVVPANAQDETPIGYETPYLNQFLNHFSWWTPQRIAMGTDLTQKVTPKDADRYQPEVQTINGNTSEQLSDLNVQSGIKDLIDQNGNVVTNGLSNIDWTKSHWFDSSTDGAAYQTQFGTTAPTNPTGNLKTTDTLALATITYTDGSQDFVTIPLNIMDSDYANQNDPNGGRINVAQNHVLDDNDAKVAITNNNSLTNVDTDNGYTWKVTPSTATPGSTNGGVVTVHYTDGTSDDVPVLVHVNSDADTHTVTPNPIDVKPGDTPDPTSGVTVSPSTPTETTINWTDGTTPTNPTPNKKNTQTADITVTYPDGSKTTVPTQITWEPTTPSTTTQDADNNDPQGQVVNTTIGNLPTPQSAITWPSGQPTGGTPTYSWSSTPDVWNQGTQPGVVKVTYPDGTADYVPTQVNVTNTPIANDITVPQNGTVPGAPSVITWGNGTMPTGTNITWRDTPDVSQPGDTTGNIQVTYPGNYGTVIMPVIVHVTPTGVTSSTFDPQGQSKHYDYGDTISTDGRNLIKDGTISSTDTTHWIVPPVTTQPGYQLVHVGVTRTVNGTTETKDVPVIITVGTAAEKYTPAGQNLTVNQGDATPDAGLAITNKFTNTNATDKLPDGTTYGWAVQPDTSIPGTQSDLVKVTYPDNSIDYVPVNVTVVPSTLDNAAYQPSYPAINVQQTKTGTSSPTFTGTDGNAATNVPVKSYALVGGTNGAPSWANIDPSTGKVTVRPGTDVALGSYNVPVTVTYQDNSTDQANVVVSVTGANYDKDNGDATYYGNQMMISFQNDPASYHKTSTDYQPSTGNSAFRRIVVHTDWDHQTSTYLKTVTYVLNNAGTEYVNQDDPSNTSDTFLASQITYQWQNGYAPNTNASAFNNGTASTLYRNADGLVNKDEQTSGTGPLSGNSKWRYHFTVGSTAADKLGLTSGSYSGSWCNVYFNFYGATAGAKQSYQKGTDISNLSQATFSKLVNTADLTNAGWTNVDNLTDAPAKSFTMSWAPNGMPSTANPGHVKGTVRLTFNDQTTGSATTSYLDVPVTIAVTGTNSKGDTYYGDNSMTLYSTVIPSVHKTTDATNSTPDVSLFQFPTITYYYNWKQGTDGTTAGDYQSHTTYNLTQVTNADGTKKYVYKNATDPSDQFNASDIQLSWVNAPSTNVSAFDGNTGSVTNLADENDSTGNSKYGFNYQVTGDANGKIGIPASVGPEYAEAYLNFYGATGKNNIPVQYNSTVPTDADGIAAYLDQNDLGTPKAAKNGMHVTNISWAKEPGSNGKFDGKNNNGTVEFAFEDGTKLDVLVSFVSGSHVPTTPGNGKNDDTNLYVTRTINYDVNGVTDAHGAPHAAIAPVVQTVHYVRDGYHVINTDGTGDDSAIIWNAWQLADGQKSQFPAIGSVEQINGYDSYVNGTKAEKVKSAAVQVNSTDTPQNGATVTVTYQKQANTPIKYDPTSKDDNMTVTRTIKYDVSGTGHAAITSVVQPVDYVREDANGNAGHKDPVTGVITYVPWTVKKGETAEFPAINQVYQINGYDSYVGGTKTESVGADDVPTSINADGYVTPHNAVDVTVTYLRVYQPGTPGQNDSMNHYVTRTINVYRPGDVDPEVITQTVHFVRGGAGQSVEKVDHTLKGWTVADANNASTGATTSSWAEYDVKQLDNYTSTVDGQPATSVAANNNVTEDTKNATVTVAYTRIYQPTDSTINPNNPGTQTDMYAHPTRTINVLNPNDGLTEQVVQTVWFGRTKTVSTDPKVGTTYGDWQLGDIDANGNFAINADATKDWPAFTAPTFTGFTPNIASVEANDNVTAITPDATVDISYQHAAPAEQTFNQNIVYQDVNGNTISTAVGALTGTFTATSPATVSAADQKTAIDGHVPENWKVSSGYNYPAVETINKTNPANIIVLIEHYTKNVKPTDPGVTPNNPEYRDLFKDITRTINIYKPGEDTIDHTATQTVSFARTGTLDLVTNQFLPDGFGAWQLKNGSTTNWPAYNLASHAGYVTTVSDGAITETNVKAIPTESVTADSNNVILNVHYINNGVPYQPDTPGVNDAMNRYVTRTIHYIVPAGQPAIPDYPQTLHFTNEDAQGNGGYTDPVTGKTTYNTNWHIAGHINETTGTFDAYDVHQINGYDSYVDDTKATDALQETGIASDAQNSTVNVTYQKQANTPVPYQPGTPGVNDNMNRYVTRTIHYIVPAGQTAIPNYVQTLHFTNEDAQGNGGYIDPVTGDTTYNANWHIAGHLNETTGTFGAYNVDQLTGYDSYVDDTKATVVPQETGIASDAQNSTVNVTYQKQANTPVPYQPGTPGVNDNMNRYVTRTIHYIVPAGQAAIPDQPQTLHFTNEDANGNGGYTDPVTHETTYNTNWHLAGDLNATTGTFVEHDVNQITGYNSEVNGIAATSVAAQGNIASDHDNITVNVIYVKQNNTPVPYTPGQPGVNDAMNRYVTRTIHYIVPAGQPGISDYPQTLHFTNEDANGNGGYTDPVTHETTYNTNWHIAGHLNETTGTFAEHDVNQINGYDSYVDDTKATVAPQATGIASDAQNITVNVTYVKQNNTPVPYTPGQPGVNDSMNHYVTRTIDVYKPGATTPQVIRQTVHFTNEDAQGNGGYTDPVTGATTYNTNWHIAGNLNVTIGAWDQYDVDPVTDYTSTVDGQTAKLVPANDDITMATHDVTVTVVYTRTIQPSNPSVNPSNPEYTQMFAHPTRTINVHNPLTGVVEPNEQTVWYGRTETISTDPTVATKYGDWQIGRVNGHHFTSDTTMDPAWSEFIAPTFTGYVPNPAQVEAIDNIMPTTNDVTVDITYTKENSQPTTQPTAQPTIQPTIQPTVQPTSQPTAQPTSQPTQQSTEQPTTQPTEQPTTQPTQQPTQQPTERPTQQPTEQPTQRPTTQPTQQPTQQPTAQPTSQPTQQPTTQPTVQPTEQPTEQPTSQPTAQPTSQPTQQSTEQPTTQPTEQLTTQPTQQPTQQPTDQPTAQPTQQPTNQPTTQPTEQPTQQPTEQPTSQPTVQPTEQPTSQPTQQPTTQPTSQLTQQSTAQPTTQSTSQSNNGRQPNGLNGNGGRSGNGNGTQPHGLNGNGARPGNGNQPYGLNGNGGRPGNGNQPYGLNDNGGQPGNGAQPNDNQPNNGGLTNPANVTANGNNQAKQLPQTGNYDDTALVGLGLAGLAAMLVLGWKRKHD